jgi:hypothetical protein
MKNIHIDDSYKVWSTTMMWAKINVKCSEEYDTLFADRVLNRTYRGMYIEWYLHNIGYWLTLPFIKNNQVKALNERFKHLDLEEHK